MEKNKCPQLRAIMRTSLPCTLQGKIFLKLLYLVLQPGQKLHGIEKIICYLTVYKLGYSFVRNVKTVLSIPFFSLSALQEENKINDSKK